MKQAHQQSKKSLWMVAGLSLLGGAAWLSCQPGELPCDSTPEWQQICAKTGGAGGSGGSGGGMPMGGAGGGPVVDRNTPVKDCTQWKTLGEMDKFFLNRCAAGGGTEGAQCHVSSNAAVWSDFTAADVWSRLKDKEPKISCKGAKMINSGTWGDSVILAKVKAGTGTPMCPPGGSNPGVGMPPQATFTPKMDLLTADETKCLENFLKAIAGVP